MLGLEAGQPAFGDVYAWFRDILSFPLSLFEEKNQMHDSVLTDVIDRIIPALSERAQQRGVSARDTVALDWFSGRRAPFAHHRVRSAISGIDLSTDAVDIFAALVRATAFGTRRIHDHLREYQVPIEYVVTVGGIPKKAPYVVQTLADVLQKEIFVAETENASARGAALLAAVVAGIYPSTQAAIERLASPRQKTYSPNRRVAGALDEQYDHYRRLAEAEETVAKR
jgi:L-ribulokinase